MLPNTAHEWKLSFKHWWTIDRYLQSLCIIIFVFDTTIHCQSLLQWLLLVSSLVVENDMQAPQHHLSVPLGTLPQAFASRMEKKFDS